MPPRSAAIYHSANAAKGKRKDALQTSSKSTQMLLQSADALEAFKDEDERKKWLQTHDKDGSGNFQRSEFLKLLTDLAGDITADGADAATLLPDSLVSKIFGDKDGLDVDEVYAGLKRCILSLIHI